MSEELIQKNLVETPEKMGDWNFYNIGATTLKALKGAKIIPDKDYDEFESKKPDALVVKKPLVIAAIEYKVPSQLRTEKQIAKAIAQEIGTAQALQAKVYIVTDGKKSIWVNPANGHEILQEDGSKISLNFDKNNAECILLINKIRASINTTNDTIKAAASVDPLPLAEKVWQDLWAVSGATPENCLYTFVEIFIFKYLSDLEVLKGMYSFYDLLSKYSGNNENEVLEFYASIIRVKIKELFPGNPKDKTTIINGTIFVSKDDKAVSGYATVFHKILKRFNDFGTLENIDYDFKSKLFETFLKESISKKNWGQYFTPLKVVRAIVNMADIEPGMSICDPACGVGKFLLEPILHSLERLYAVSTDEAGNEELLPQITLSGFDKGFDKDEQKTIILAKANMLIYMSGMIKEHPGLTKQFAELFNKTFTLQTNSILGTLAKPITEEYDLILTNPPYVMSGSSNLKEEIAKDDALKKYFSISAMGIEGLFMEWIVRALKPGKKAFIVVPDGIMNRSNDKKLRDFILEQCNIDAVISLPLNTFFTTNKKTYILALTKKVAVNVGGIATLPKQTTPVFTYLCSEIGETRDVYRFDIEQNDLETASDLFNMFKGAKAKFKTDDKRCKIVDIDDFYNGTHWCVDRWWSKSDKIELGIKDEVKSINLSDFRGLLGDAVLTLSELDEPLSELEKKKNSDNGRIANVPLTEAFDIFRGSGQYTKSYVQNHSGIYPLYSGNTVGEFANIDAFDYNTPCLSWAIDGLAGYIMIHEGPFSATNHRGVLVRKNEKIDLHYAKYVLEPIFREMKKGREGNNGENEYTSLPPFMIKDLSFPLPLDENGEPDLAMQRKIASKHVSIEQTKESINEIKERIAETNISLDNEEYAMRFYPLPSLFDTIKGLSKYTKKYGNAHNGAFPVYSASSKGPLTSIDTYDYDGKYMTWSTNGFAGTILVLDGKFSINGDRGVLIPKDGRTDIDLDYMKFTLEPLFRDLAKGRKGDNGEDEFTKLYPSMLDDIMVPVPVDDQGNISLDAQKEIAAKYLAIEQCKSEVILKLDTLIQQKIEL